jgi:hypothetical protein
MNTKDYVDYYPELANVNIDEQVAILEQARYQAFVVMRLSSISAAFLIASWLVAMLIPILAYFLFGFSIVTNALAIGVGVALALTMRKKLNGFLLKKGLQEVLSKNDRRQPS